MSNELKKALLLRFRNYHQKLAKNSTQKQFLYNCKEGYTRKSELFAKVIGDFRLTSAQEKAVKDYWKGINIDMTFVTYYNYMRQKEFGPDYFDPRFMPDDIHYYAVDPYFNDWDASRSIDDKNLYNLYFHDVPLPHTVIHSIDNRLMDEKFNPISLDEAVEIGMQHDELVFKDAVDSGGGHGVIFWSRNDDGTRGLRDILEYPGNGIMQDVLSQHEDLKKLNPSSLNTIRLLTFSHDGKIEMLSAALRVGASGSRVDNASSGGYFCGINPDGTLKSFGFSLQGLYTQTTSAGTKLSECKVPKFDECRELVLRLSNRFYRTSKLISWDIAIDADGIPTIIEVNLFNGGLNVHQLCNGPLFGDRTREIVDKIFADKTIRIFNKRWN